ncbi:MAG TPA: bifunctional UDP-N-acetylglucosamine diphosphorylase/glucosamine-1-phosphate N-acetyltransferase GlmU [Vicinamibacteria bacterium]|nr:bifunctional UDP-N-acetylglucosamine diphosphorylase/glucosamine-1-phosphate N-acetyltransferase GlmU [Vicinamibacteria bacterium]
MPKVQAVVLAAGKGTRLKSSRAKVLHPALGLPLLEHVLRAIAPLEALPVTVVVGFEAEAVERAFAGRNLVFVRQDPPLGTGHALQVARDRWAAHPDRTLLVLNGDLPLLRSQTVHRLLEVHARSRAAATLLSIVLGEPGAYGRVVRDGKGRVAKIVEAKDASPEERGLREINAGVYAFEVPRLLEVLGQLRPQNAQGEYYLTDLVGLLAAAGHPVEAVAAAEPSEAFGVNSRGELATASRLLRVRRLEALMAAGVAVEDPETTTVGLDAEVAADAVLRPFTLIEGRTQVAAGASVGPFARLVDSEIGVDAQVLDHCLLRECVVEAGASIGPFAHIRPGSRIGAKARVGNFVELKKTLLGAGSKAPHLSYVGDTTVGPGVNIGAGTITCNYDGVSKYPTHIEAGAFVGSNSTLVAPVTVGAGAYVGAGSVITRDVPPDALGVGRARQLIKEGWARLRRERTKPAGHQG